MERVDIRLERQGAQRRRTRVQVPGCVQRFQRVDPTRLVRLNPAVRQRKGAVLGCMAQGERQVGVIVSQLRESLGHLLEEAGLVSGPLHPHRQHGHKLGQEQVATLLPFQVERSRPAFQVAPYCAQPRRRPGDIEAHRESLAQPQALPLLIQEPERQARFRVGVQVEQPAGPFNHCPASAGLASGCAGASPLYALPAA